MAAMYYIVGLGNPGEKYANTRHNVGWHALDDWCARAGLPASYDSAALSGRVRKGFFAATEVTVLYPDTFMNHSGSAVAKLVPATEVDKLIVVYDDIDIPFGEIKISRGGGAGGHNGVRSITHTLGTPDYIRVRIGIAPRGFFSGEPKRPAGAKLPRFVLQPFSSREKKALPALLEKVSKALDVLVREGVATAMNTFN